jgi:hypothetical protein
VPLPPQQQIRYRKVRVRVRRRPRSWDRPRHFILSILLGTCVGLLMTLDFVREYEQNPAKVVMGCDVKCPPTRCSSDP